jgi:hypothetical protein
MPEPQSAPPLTNILSLPLAHMTVETGNNEDWIDVIQYITPDERPVDIRGIRFEMEIRRIPQAHEVVLRASTENRWLTIGAPPHTNCLMITVPEIEMRGRFAGQYIGDIRAKDTRNIRRIITMDLIIIEGITKTLLPQGILQLADLAAVPELLRPPGSEVPVP